MEENVNKESIPPGLSPLSCRDAITSTPNKSILIKISLLVVAQEVALYIMSLLSLYYDKHKRANVIRASVLLEVESFRQVRIDATH